MKSRYSTKTVLAEFFAFNFLSNQLGYTPGTAGIVSCTFDPKEIVLVTLQFLVLTLFVLAILDRNDTY